MPLRLRSLVPIVAIALAACGSDPTGVGACTTIAVPALVVVVSDSVSGNAPAAVLVKAATDGFVDSTTTGSADVGGGPASFSLAHEHVGTYTVTVTSPQFHPWTRSDVVVSRTGCHVNTVTVEARLQR